MRYFLLYTSLCVIIGSITLLLYDNWAATQRFIESPSAFLGGTKPEPVMGWCGTCNAGRAMDTYKNVIIDGPNGAIDGKAIFLGKCASCHNPSIEKSPLAGVNMRWTGRERLLKKFIRNSAKVIRSGDAYANALYNEYDKANMTAFPTMTDAEIDAVLAYISVRQ
jgi:mono/diheme cytochrome c family protein